MNDLIRLLEILHPNNGKRAVPGKSADPPTPRAKSLGADDPGAAGEFAAGTPDKGNPGELLRRNCPAVRTAGITRG